MSMTDIINNTMALVLILVVIIDIHMATHILHIWIMKKLRGEP